MFRDAVEVTNAFEMNPGPLGSSEIIQDILRETGKRSITVTDKVFVNGMEYQKGTFVVIGYNDNGLIFGQITSIITEESFDPLLVTSVYDTVEFKYQIYCYVTEEKTEKVLRILKFSELQNYHPLDGIRLPGSKLIFIRLKYAILTR